MMLLNRAYTAPQQFHLAFKACAKERPLRLAADLAYFLFQAERDFGSELQEASVTDTYQALVRVVSVSGIKSDDLLIMFVCLKRYYANLVAARRGDETFQYFWKHSPVHKALHAAYVSQAMLYDDPLARKAWMQHSMQPFKTFLNEALDFCSVIDYDFYFDEAQLMSAFRELTGPIEKQAIECYRRLAPKQSAPKPSKPIAVPSAEPMDTESLCGSVPSSPSSSMMMVDAMDCAVPCHTPAAAEVIPQRSVLPEDLEQQLVIVKRRKVYHESAYGDVITSHPVMAPA